MVIILQYWPDDKDGIKNAVEQKVPKVEFNKDVFIGSHLADAKDICRKHKKRLKETKEVLFIVTSTTLGEICGDKITKKLLKFNSNAQIFVFTTKPEEVKKKKRVIGVLKKHKRDMEGYNYIASMVDDVIKGGDPKSFLEKNPPPER